LSGIRSSAGATIYYNFFWNKESLYINYAIDDVTVAESGKLPIDFTVSNTGKQSAIVQSISLVQVFGQDSSLQDCSSRRIGAVLMPPRWVPWEPENKADPKKVFELAKPLAPSRKERKLPPLLINPNNVELISLDFLPKRIATLKDKSNVTYCFLVTYSDRFGKLYTRGLPGWSVNINKVGETLYGVSYDYPAAFDGPFQLLPVDGEFVEKGFTLGGIGSFSDSEKEEGH